MVRVVSFLFEGNMFPLFIDDTDAGYSGKDVLSRPGVYEEVTTDVFTLPIAELNGSIDGYSTKLMGLIVAQDPNDPKAKQVVDYTQQVKRLLTVPEVAARMLISRESEENREFLQTALEVISFYEKVTPDTKVFLPEAAFEYVEPDVAKKMRSVRHISVLRNSDNQEIVQRSCTEEYGVVLHTLEEIHAGNDGIPSALDILRVAAPCRKEIKPGVFRYQGIYHTPYYRVDATLRGTLPSHLAGINGYVKNNLNGIMKHERHMYDNLFTLYRSDVATYVAELCTGILLTTPYGQKLKRLIGCKSADLFGSLTSDLAAYKLDGVECDVSYADVQATIQDGISSEKLAQLVHEKLSVSLDCLTKLIEEYAGTTRVVDTEHIPFVLLLSDEEKETLTKYLSDKMVITTALFTYLTQLCCKAYSVNWGHTGATRAIPGMVRVEGINEVSKAMEVFLGVQLGKAASRVDANLSILYPDMPGDSDDSDVDRVNIDVGSSAEDDVDIDFDFYITDRTAQLIRDGTLDTSYFNTVASGAESTESGIVEYWRKVNGDKNLAYFLSSAFLTTGAIEIFLQAFYKLMRWGEIKPSLLVFPDFPEVKTVFDLNVGKEIPNTTVVDESKLVKVNGCSHTLSGVLVSNEILDGAPAVVGLLLCRDYGSVKKNLLASLVDIGDMCVNGSIDVSELLTLSQVPLTGEKVYDIATLENSGFDIFVSDRNIKLGLQYSIQPAQLNEIYLLQTPGVLRSMEYLRSKQSTMVVTTKDRQYQILTAYVNTIRELYRGAASELKGAQQTTTAELSAIATAAYEIYLKGVQAPDANAVRAQQALSQMNLDGSIPQAGPVIKFGDDALEGKFAIISDVDMQSGLPAIEFTDDKMKSISLRLRDRIVLLMLETPEKMIFCRKDIAISELLVKDKKIEHHKYPVIAKAVDALKAGKPFALRNATAGVAKPIVLHQSLKGLL